VAKVHYRLSLSNINHSHITAIDLEFPLTNIYRTQKSIPSQIKSICGVSWTALLEDETYYFFKAIVSCTASSGTQSCKAEVTVGLKHTEGNDELGSAMCQTHTFSTDGTILALKFYAYIDVSLF
jgi:hypothetical protein